MKRCRTVLRNHFTCTARNQKKIYRDMTGVVLFELCFVWVVFCLGCVLFVLCFVWVVICLSCVLFELFFVWVVFRWNIRIQFKNQFENTRRRAIYKKNYINLDKAKIKQERWRTRMKRRQYQINLIHHSDESIEFQNPGWKLKWKHPKGTISKKFKSIQIKPATQAIPN